MANKLTQFKSFAPAFAALALILAACSSNTTTQSQSTQASAQRSANQQAATVTPLPTRVVVAETSVAVDGVLALSVPQISLGFEQNGKVTDVSVTLGQRVKKGDVLAKIDDTTLQDAVIDAQAQVESQNASIQQQLTPATKEELAAAQAALSVAYTNYNTTKAGATTSDMATAQKNLEVAKKQYLSAQVSRDLACGGPLGTASINCQSQEASYGNAYESMLAAQSSLDKLNLPVTQETLTQAYASVASAKAKLDSLKNGVTEAQAKINQAQLDQANTALSLAQSNLSKATLLSPCDCIVQAVNVAVGAQSSGTAFQLVDLSNLQFTTTNLTERDVATIKVGAAVTVRLKAHSESLSGKVSAILAQSSGSQSGTALYTVLIQLDPSSKLLLPGMTGQAEI